MNILITKDKQCPPKTIEAFKKGLRTQQILNELQNEAQIAIKKNREYYLRAINKRKNIWKFIDKLLKDERIEFIEIRSLRVRLKLLEKYNKLECSLDKNKYKSSLEGDQTRELNHIIKMSFHTWKNIFET